MKTAVRYVFADLMVAAGIAHLVRPDFFVSIVLSYLPAPTTLVLVSGVAEMASGLGLLFDRT